MHDDSVVSGINQECVESLTALIRTKESEPSGEQLQPQSVDAVATPPNESASDTTRFRFVVLENVRNRRIYKPYEPTVAEFIKKMMRRGHIIGPKDGTCIVAAVIRPGTKVEGKNVVACTAIVLDIDGKKKVNGSAVQEYVNPEDIFRTLPFRGFAHSSHSHTPEHPKFRVYFPLAEPVSVEDHERLWHWINALIDGLNDPSCKNPDHLYFFPRCPAQRKPHAWTRELHGPLLSIDCVPQSFTIPAASQHHGSGHDPIRRTEPRPSSTAPDTPARVALTLTAMKVHPIILWLKDHPEAHYDLWRGVATNIAACVRDGTDEHVRDARELFVWISSGRKHGATGAPYTPFEINRCFNRALSDIRAGKSGPVTYPTLVAAGLPPTFAETADGIAPVVDCRRWCPEWVG